MQEKNNCNSNSLGFCRRLFNFFIENFVARGAKRVTLGQQESFGPPAKPKGEEILVHHQDHENSNNDLGLNSEIPVHFKQREGLESWTPVEKFADHSQMHMADGIPDQVRPIRGKATEKGKQKVSEETPGRKKELPLLLEKIVQPLSKSSPTLTNAVKCCGTKKIKESEEEESKKDKGKSIPNGNLTLPIQYEEVKRTPGRLIGSPSINQRSETFINSRKEEMRKHI